MRILIVKLSSLGDLFHALPAVHNLKMETQATIDWVTHTDYVGMVQCFDAVDRVIGFPRHAFLRNARTFWKALRCEHYDLVIDMQGLAKSAMVTLMARGQKRIGPSFQREGARLAYHAIAGRKNKARHAVDENLDIIRHLGLPLQPPVFPITVPSASTDVVPHPNIVICPVSRWQTKNWPSNRFADVAQRLIDLNQASITLIGAPGDRDVCENVTHQIKGNVRNLAGTTTLVEMASILAGADLLISNDSGPVHMAAALGTRTLVIFGPTRAERTGPYGQGHTVITSPRVCKPCMKQHCTHPDGPCIQDITTDMVTEKALSILDSRNVKQASPAFGS